MFRNIVLSYYTIENINYRIKNKLYDLEILRYSKMQQTKSLDTFNPLVDTILH